MNSGPIHTLSLEKRISRREEVLPAAWVGTTAEHAPNIPEQKECIAWAPDATLEFEPSDAPVLVMVRGDHPAAHASLLAAMDAGRRVYVLAEPGWGEGKRDPGLDSRSPGLVLVRRVPEVPVSSVLDGPQAHIWLGAPSSVRTPWRLLLDLQQSEAFRLLFLQLFWEQAKDEAWIHDGRLVFHPPAEAPFDIPGLPRNAQIRLAPANQPLSLSAKQVCAVWYGAPPREAPQLLWLPASGQDHDALKNLVAAGISVLSGPIDLPELCLEVGKGLILLAGQQQRLELRLNRSQIMALAPILQTPPAWTFKQNIRLGDHENQPDVRIWLPGRTEPEPLEREQHISQGQVRARSLREAEATQPSAWRAPQPLALSVRYTYEVLPPQVPAEATEDALLGQWHILDQKFRGRTSECRDALRATAGFRGRLRSAFSRLLSAVTGFERSQNALESELSQLEKGVPSQVGPQEAERLFERLQSVEAQAKTLSSELEAAERKAREDEEREKQEKAWRIRTAEARAQLPSCRQSLAAHEGQLADLNARLPTFEAELKERKVQLETLTENLRSISTQQVESNIDSSGDLEKQKQAIQKQCDELKLELRDLETSRKRTLDERSAEEKVVRQWRAKAAELTQQAEEPFAFRPPPFSPGSRSSGAEKSGTPAGRFIPAATAAPVRETVPAEALPTVGALRAHKGQRYLVIRRWEELDQGEHDARRLKAHLVAPEDV